MSKMPTWKLASLTDAQKLASPLFSKDTLLGPGYTNEPILLSFEAYFHQPIKTASITTTDAWIQWNQSGEGLEAPLLRNQMKWLFFIKVDGINMYTQFSAFVKSLIHILFPKRPGQGDNVSCRTGRRYNLIFVEQIKTKKIPKLSSVGNIWERVGDGDTWLSPQVHGVRSSM